jgi:hypothetical protein
MLRGVCVCVCVRVRMRVFMYRYVQMYMYVSSALDAAHAIRKLRCDVHAGMHITRMLGSRFRVSGLGFRV